MNIPRARDPGNPCIFQGRRRRNLRRLRQNHGRFRKRRPRPRPLHLPLIVRDAGPAALSPADETLTPLTTSASAPGGAATRTNSSRPSGTARRMMHAEAKAPRRVRRTRGREEGKGRAGRGEGARASAGWQDGGRSIEDGVAGVRRGRPTATTTPAWWIRVSFATARSGAPGWRRLIGARDAIDARSMIGTIALADPRALIRVYRALVSSAARRRLRLHNEADTAARRPLHVHSSH